MSPDLYRDAKIDRGITLHHPRLTSLTYETFYGLREKPFSLSSDPAFFYNSSSHASAFHDLLSGIQRRESLGVVTGDIGTGKTTLCRTVLQNLDRKTFSAFVPDPFASREDLLKIVLADFGVVSAEDLASGRLRGASRTELSYLLYEFVETLSPLQAFAVVFIDEAQNLSLPLLEEIRILSDSDGREKQLQVVLVGQLELREKLRLPEMRQVAQRISVRCNLEALERDGVDGYISYRLHVAGGSPDRVRFSREAVDTVYEASGGVPRLINRLCDRALHHGHLRRAAVIDRTLVETAGVDVESGAPARRGSPAAAEQLVDPADAWFAEIDARVNGVEAAETVEVPALGDSPAAPAVPPSRGERVRVVPLTHMEAFTRIWLRRMKIAVLAIAVLAAAGLGYSLVAAALSEPLTMPAIESPALRLVPAPVILPISPPDDPAPAAVPPDSTSSP